MINLKKNEPRSCVRCYQIANEKDQYCIKCGAPLINRCGDVNGKFHRGCSHINKEDAAFCAKCGYPTIFKQQGLLYSSPLQSPQTYNGITQIR